MKPDRIEAIFTAALARAAEERAAYLDQRGIRITCL
jgi:hypothetical protein